MGAQMRIYRQRIKSVNSIKKITNAMELIAAARVIKARQRASEAMPYTTALTRAVSAVATNTSEDHPLTTDVKDAKRAGVLVIAADRGLAGAYSVSAIKRASELIAHLQGEGKEVVPYLVGRKAVSYYKFRKRDFAQEWSGFTDAPTFENARDIADRLTEDFLKPTAEGGVDEIHVVFTLFRSMVRQDPHVLRLLPLEVVDADSEREDGLDLSVNQYEEGQLAPEYDFEPSASEVLDLLLPKYVRNRIYTALLSSSASELAARQRAMKSATDNAGDLIKRYERLANQARQAGITQEISEIVGGADALADAKK
ncbi:F0F1 ATP synthase subunit gamma [Terracoccus luteus]|jgi:F-type H+-transporting ATPase subunit gamma|uniref:ATP synthase gamma chain n=2 Tax=Terracoccus luteus TaxID=53356 RepID=A0A839PTN4_9MICO|nr:F0F1 ATP synthase subunit gamma [Terracoccus luteus]MBB2985385.1 F-type H+-transporting ATPase subunit gamma [Terracoccus luteus]MCP2171037.1 F-type H+-transporting ATPase subunit gamma [Terracoccus luteus]